MNKATFCFIAGTGICGSLATAAWADYAAAQRAYLQGSYSTALREFKADKGTRSLYRIGMMNDYGIGVPENIQEALKWYLQAAGQGMDAAQFRIGELYENGRGVPRDDGKAVEWYRKAADSGLSIAQYRLGESYQNGKGVSRNLPEAVKWIRKASEMGT